MTTRKKDKPAEAAAAETLAEFAPAAPKKRGRPAKAASNAPAADAAEIDLTPAAGEPNIAPAEELASAPVETKGPSGKLATLLAALSVPGGATVADLIAATGWQAHSVRGAISGSLKKKHGIVVTSEKIDGVHRYSVAAA